jgi:hypothetical protein
MVSFKRLRKPKPKPKPKVCNRCMFLLYGKDYEGCTDEIEEPKPKPKVCNRCRLLYGKADERQRRKADEEITRWTQEIEEEERRRVPSEPVSAKLTRTSMNGTVQKWIINGSEYLDPNVFLYDIEDEVKLA